MDAFFTRQRANEGIKLPLALPDGTDTEHYICIRGVDSDAFKSAESNQKRLMLQLLSSSDKVLDTGEIEAATREGQLSILAALVISWSFDQECSLDNVKQFLREAPQIAQQIDKIASRRKLFFKKGLTPSTPTQEASLS